MDAKPKIKEPEADAFFCPPGVVSLQLHFLTLVLCVCEDNASWTRLQDQHQAARSPKHGGQTGQTGGRIVYVLLLVQHLEVVSPVGLFTLGEKCWDKVELL